MNIKVSGSNMSVGVALTKYVKEHINKNVKKYFENAVSADIRFRKENDLFNTSIVINEGVSDSIDINSNATANDVYTCFNDAAKKVVKQLRRYKRKIKNHRRQQVDSGSYDIDNTAPIEN